MPPVLLWCCAAVSATSLLSAHTVTVAAAVNVNTLDLADPGQSLRYWLPHPVLGEASFDAFEQHPSNPVFTGKEPWPWPVNGFLAGGLRNKPATMYVGLYQRGYKASHTVCNYTSAAADCACAMLQLQSDDHGDSWHPWPADDPLACNGDPASFDQGTGCPDGSTAPAEDGGVHLVWDWNVGLGDARVPHAGLGYSHAPNGNQPSPGHPTGRGCLDPTDECPGEFVRSPRPLNDAVDNRPLDHGFVKLYGGTIIQRKNDWLIVSAIGGGSWAMAGMTAPNASGPYSHPTLLLWPQSAVFHPAPTEPYPAFRYGDHVYAPFTSVAANRGYQILYRAPLERATEPSAWEVVQTGSLYHWEGGKEGAIWGQTFSAHVDEASDMMEVMYPTLSASSVGAINLASRQWSEPFSHGFWVSAPSADSHAKMLKTLGCFTMNMSVTLPVGGAWGLHWNDRTPIQSTGGPGFPAFPGTVRGSFTSLSFDGSGGYSLGSGDTGGNRRNGTCVLAPRAVLRLTLIQSETLAAISLHGCAAGPVSDSVVLPSAAVGGGMIVRQGQGGALYVSEMTVKEMPSPSQQQQQRPQQQQQQQQRQQQQQQQQWIALLPSEAMGSCYNGGSGRWQAVRSEAFTFGAGFVHPGGKDDWGYAGKTVSQEPMVKYNFVGRAARLRLPMGPGYGLIQVSIDGRTPQNISLYAPTNRNSSVVWRWASDSDYSADTDGPQQLRQAHAVTVRWRAPPPPTSPTLQQQQHPPWIPWVTAEDESAIFGVPIGGDATAPLLGSNITSVAQCQALCEAHENCTTYSMHMPGKPCWAGKTDPLGWCTKCWGRTDGVWQLHPVDGVMSARRVVPQPPPPPPPPPVAGQQFPVDVLEFLPAFADAPAPEVISNVLPRTDSGGNILNSHDGNLVQDWNSGAFYLYGYAIPLEITAADYNNCVPTPLIKPLQCATHSSCLLPIKRLSDSPEQVESGPPGVKLVYKPTAYRSFDLATWEMASEDLGVVWQASDQMNVRFNRKTGKYVAIYRGNCGAAEILVAVADGPIGPFTQLPSIAIPERVGSQMAWMSDKKGRAFAMYNTGGPPASNGFDGFPDKQCLIELTADWTAATGRKSCWVAQDGFGLEGGALWTRGDTYYWAAGSPCCNCYLGGSGRVYTTKEPMGNWSYATNINPPVLPRPPLPPPDKRSPGSNPPTQPAKQRCTLTGDWVGGVYLASGGQPLRGGLTVSRLPDGRYNFSQNQAHDSEIVGLGTVQYTQSGVANITITEGVSKGAHGVADLWPGVNSSINSNCFTRIIWNGGGCTWGKRPEIPETRFEVSSQMFGVATITRIRDGQEHHLYTGERYQTAPDGVFAHGFMYWQPLEYRVDGTPQALNWTDGFALNL